jgi:uncharacterized damage-inducible protein DinB
MDLLQHLRAHARANRLANRRLHEAMAPLSREEWHAARTGFFPSLAATLNHVLAVDAYYLDALHGVADMAVRWEAFVPADTHGELAARQAASDARLIAFCDALTPETMLAEVALDRTTRVDREVVARVLDHLFMHQTHHRGQAHAMLAGTRVAPPQLDEFLLAGDAAFREVELAAEGWDEAMLLDGRLNDEPKPVPARARHGARMAPRPGT